MNVCVTGRRDLTPEGKRVIVQRIREILTEPGIETIYFGGARGADTIALAAAIKYRKGSVPRLVAVVPDTVERQPWEARTIVVLADEVIELKHPISREDGYRSFIARDEWMVDRSGRVEAFWDRRRKGGTWKTIQHAWKQGVSVVVNPL